MSTPAVQDPDFTSIRFGYASAETEGATAPELLLRAYLDRAGLIDEALYGHRFLFLGYKGSGKSAIGQRSRLLAEEKADLFVTSTFLADFPYSTLGKIAPGGVEPESRYPTAWAWLLLLKLVSSLTDDNGAEPDASYELDGVVRGLKDVGLFPVPELKKLALASSKTSFRAQIPKLLEYAHEREFSGQDLQFVALVDKLKEVVAGFRTPNRHVLMVDGLDEILTKRQVQYDSLAALISEASRLNRYFAQSGVAVKIVVLCRTDLFEQVPAPNKNKLRQDSAVTLDWYHDPRQPAESALIDLINLRAEVAYGRRYDVIGQHLPKHADGTEMPRALLELTRHTPRDLVQLFGCLQRFHHGRDPMSRDHVMSAFREYSIGYFLPELKDELVGYVPPAQIDLFFSVIASLRKREFTRRDLERAAEDLAPDLDMSAALAALFECSGIGTLHAKEHHGRRSTTYVTFKYRNRNSSLGFDQRFLLHKGVWKALNIG